MSGNRSFDPVFARRTTPTKRASSRRSAVLKFVSPGFFATLGTPLLAGRDLTWAETFQKRPVAIISENFAREYWGDPAKALGKRIRVGNTDDWREIIGVAGDVYDDGVSQTSNHRGLLAAVPGSLRRAEGSVRAGTLASSFVRRARARQHL